MPQLPSHTNSPASTDLTDTFLLLVPRCGWRPVTLLSLYPGLVSHGSSLLSEVTSPLTLCPHEPGTDYCQLTATHSWRPAGLGPAQAPGVQWAQGRGSIGLRRGVSRSHDSQLTVKAT